MISVFLAALLFAQPYAPAPRDPIDLRQGIPAPFSGTLLPYRLSAEITVRLEQEEARKKLDVKTATTALGAKHTFEMAMVKADLRFAQRSEDACTVDLVEFKKENRELRNPSWLASPQLGYLLGAGIAIAGLITGAVIAITN